MHTGTYKLAERVIRVESLYETVQKMCQSYACEGEPDFIVTVTPEDIAFEAARAEQPGHSEQYLETLAVYRKISEKMVEYDTVLCHGSVIAVDGEAYMFTAKSGTGKSTHTALWRQEFGERAVMVNDDKPLLRVVENQVIAYGTPWNGKHKLGCNMAAPLKALYNLHRGSVNTARPLTGTEAMTMLLQQVYRPADPMKMAKTVELMSRICANTNTYRLECNMDPEAAHVAYDIAQK